MPKIHTFEGLTSGEVYDLTQTDDSIKDGDVLVIPQNLAESHNGIVGILIEAWPTSVHGHDPDHTNHQLHGFDNIEDFLAHGDNEKYRASIDLALETSA